MCRRLSRQGTKHDCVGVRFYILFGGRGGCPIRILAEDQLFVQVFRCFPPFFQTNTTAMSRLVHSRRLAYLFPFHPSSYHRQPAEMIASESSLQTKAEGNKIAQLTSGLPVTQSNNHCTYKGAGNSLARPGGKQATATEV